jgi:hypothetical protein
VNLIFLDFDGVLNNTASLAEGIHLCPEKVIMVRNLCIELDCQVVISSSWRVIHTLAEMKELLYRTGFHCRTRIIDTTPINGIMDAGLNRYRRGYEIEKWLCSKAEDYNYAIIDDIDEFLPYQKSRFVRTNDHTGITSDDIFKIKQILTRETK